MAEGRRGGALGGCGSGGSSNSVFKCTRVVAEAGGEGKRMAVVRRDDEHVGMQRDIHGAIAAQAEIIVVRANFLPWTALRRVTRCEITRAHLGSLRRTRLVHEVAHEQVHLRVA